MKGGELDTNRCGRGISAYEKKYAEGGGGYLVRDGLCVTLKQLAEAAGRAKATLPLEELFGDLFSGL